MTQPVLDPPTRYATLARLKASMRITAEDRDELLAEALDVASRYIDQDTDRRFWADPVPTMRSYRTLGRLVVDDDGVGLLVDDIAAPAEGITIEMRRGRGGVWVPFGDYDAEPDNAITDGAPVTLLRADDWDRADRVRVTARHGWPRLPAEVAMACRIQALRLYKRKDSPEGIAGNAEWGTVRITRTDPDVLALIQHLVLHSVG